MDDLISRAAVKQAFNQYKKEKKVRTPFEANRIFDLSEIINSLPAVDAVPLVHGRWGEDCDCSVCGFKPYYEFDIHTLSYCPNCGAKMGG